MRYLVVSLTLLAGCVDHQPSPTSGRVDGLTVQLLDPAPNALGSVTNPVAVRKTTFNVIARDDQGQQFPQDVTAKLYISFGGVKVGAVSACGSDSGEPDPIAMLSLKGGALLNYTADLPQAFGPTSVWIEDTVSHAVGASNTIYFRNPYVADVMTPVDPMAANATFCTSWAGKFIYVDHPAKPTGKLILSSVFGNAVVVTDTSDPAAGYNNIYLFTFGRPPGNAVPGRVVDSFSGDVSKFVGFTEVNFPILNLNDAVDTASIPAPAVINGADIANLPKLNSLNAGPVQATGTVCDPQPPNPTGDPNIDSTIKQWVQYNTFTLDLGRGDCQSINNLGIALPAKTVGNFDPTKIVGKSITVTGMLKNSSGQNSVTDANGNPISCDMATPCAKGNCVGGICKKNPFNFWSVVVRGQTDVPQQ